MRTTRRTDDHSVLSCVVKDVQKFAVRQGRVCCHVSLSRQEHVGRGLRLKNQSDGRLQHSERGRFDLGNALLLRQKVHDAIAMGLLCGLTLCYHCV